MTKTLALALMLTLVACGGVDPNEPTISSPHDTGAAPEVTIEVGFDAGPEVAPIDAHDAADTTPHDGDASTCELVPKTNDSYCQSFQNLLRHCTSKPNPLCVQVVDPAYGPITGMFCCPS